MSTHYTKKIVNNVFRYSENIQHEIIRAELAAMIDSHVLMCSHLENAVDIIESLLTFMDTSIVKNTLAVQIALLQVHSQVEKINQMKNMCGLIKD